MDGFYSSSRNTRDLSRGLRAQDPQTSLEFNRSRENKRGLLSACAVFVFMLLAALGLTGCVKKYTRSDIASYAKKLCGSSRLTVSEGYKEIQEDEEGYLDHLWTVTDEESGVTFHVLDDYYWALEDVENQLLNDYDSSVFLTLLDRKKLPLDNSLSLKKSEESGLVHVEVFCSFTDQESLETCYGELLSLKKAAEDAGHSGLKVTCTVRYQNPVRDFVDYEVDEGDTICELGSLDEEDLALMRRNYLTCALDYRFEDVLRDFPEEEILAVSGSPDSVRIYKADGAEEGGSQEAAQTGGSADPEAESMSVEESRRIYYEGLIGSPKFAGISFGTLYEILKREGREPQGNAWHYSFEAADGSPVEVSYDFHDLSGFNDRQGKLQKGYYYIRNDRKVRMSSYYANHFETEEIEELTGIRVYEDRKYVTEDRD